MYILHRMAFVSVRIHTFSFYTFCNTYRVLHTYDHSVWIPTVIKDNIFEVSILTLGRLMSYIYMEHPFLMFLDHTQRRSTVGRTPLDK